MAPVKRSAKDPGALQPKKFKQLKLDSMIRVSPLPTRAQGQTEEQKAPSVSSAASSLSQTEAGRASVTRVVRPSQASSDFDIAQISVEPRKQKQYLVHHLVAQRRLHNQGLEVGPGGLPLHGRGGEGRAEPLNQQNCLDIWFCLDTEEEWRDLGRELDEGWLEASSLLKRFIKPETFPPAAAMHKFLNEAVINHPQSLIRGEAFSALSYCLQTHPPGNRQTSLHMTRL